MQVSYICSLALFLRDEYLTYREKQIKEMLKRVGLVFSRQQKISGDFTNAFVTDKITDNHLIERAYIAPLYINKKDLEEYHDDNNLFNKE